MRSQEVTAEDAEIAEPIQGPCPQMTPMDADEYNSHLICEYLCHLQTNPLVPPYDLSVLCGETFFR